MWPPGLGWGGGQGISAPAAISYKRPYRPTAMGYISGVDFVMVPVSDWDRARQFYGEVLELEQSKAYGERPGGEFETGTLTLQIMDPSGFGMQPAKPTENPIALHVDD